LAPARGVPAEPLPWLLGVARKTLSTQRRSARRRSSLLAELRAEDAVGLRSATVVSDEHTVAVAEAVGRLPAHDRELLRLVVWDDVSTKEAAAVLGTSQVACRVRLHRAKRRLAAELEQDEEFQQRRQAGRFQIREETR
jgi:RNA polymerase sigma-70 factor (ECF subfamily)